MKKILVLCTGNSCRSQIAEAYLRKFAGSKAEIYSAGITAHGVHPKAITIMAEDGIDMTTHTSNNVQEYTGITFDFVLTVCDHAGERCPVFPGQAKKIYKNFPDPAKATGSPEEVMASFRSVRELLKEYSRSFATDHLS